MIAPAFKEQLMTALKTAIDAFNGGESPDAAVTKAASSNDFNAEQTRRLCETFNIARTIYHFRNGADKAASFSLADPETVVKAAVAAVAQPVKEKAADFELLYAEYQQPEQSWRSGMEVAAGDLSDLTPTRDERLDINTDDQLRLAFQAVRVHKELVKKATEDADMAEIEVDRCLQQVTQTLKQGFMADGVDKCARLIRCYADDAEYEPVLRKFGEWLPAYLMPSVTDLQKCGSIVEDRDLGDLKSMIHTARSLMQDIAGLRAVAQVMHKEALDGEKALDAIVAGTTIAKESPPDPFAGLLLAKGAQASQQRDEPTALMSFGLTTSKGDKKDKGPSYLGEVEKQLAGGTGELISGYLTSGVEKMLTRETLERNKQMTERYKNLQREAVLQDLVTNDPVLSEEDPKTVAQAYLAIMQLAPEVSMSKEIVRAILRQAVHATSISPFDASAWADLEKTIRETTGTMPPSRTIRMEAKQ